LPARRAPGDPPPGRDPRRRREAAPPDAPAFLNKPSTVDSRQFAVGIFSAPMTPLSGEQLDSRLREFLAEDVGSGDVTSLWTVPDQARAKGRLIARSGCVVSGLTVARRTFELLDPKLEWTGELPAGTAASPGTPLAGLSGRARALMTAGGGALDLPPRGERARAAPRRVAHAPAGAQ